MPKVAKGRRKRAYRPKTRSGCLTCKVRRVKCDEARPECLRCASTHRACDGYLPRLEPVEPLEPAGPPGPGAIIRVPTAAVMPGLGLPTDVHACEDSRRSFSFFVRRTSAQLAGFFGSEFWERLVLQAAHHEPPIRHAIVAVGSLHEHKAAGRGSGATFALEQYNLAIRNLLAPLPQNDERGVDVCLMACILFACFENMQGRHGVAGSHIRSGSKLLRETVYDQHNGTLKHQALRLKCQKNRYVPLEVLAEVFSGLDAEVATIIRDYKFKAYENYFSANMESDPPWYFSNIEDAKNVFEYGRHLLASSRPADSTPACDAVDSSHALQGYISYTATLLTKFSESLQVLEETRGSLPTPREEIASAVLRLHVLNACVSFYVEHLPPADRLPKDRLQPQMTEMILLGERIVSAASSSEYLGSQATSFCLDMGLVIPLYTVASHSQDKAIRLRAIRLLRSTPRQEGLWNSLVVARAAERILEVEESHGVQLRPYAGSAVRSAPPGSQAILQVDARGVRLQYERPGGGAGPHDRVVEEVVRW